MASPQKENGHVQVANELFDALARMRIPGEQRQVLDVIIRLTYGWNKKDSKISYAEFVVRTGLQQGHVFRALKALEEHNLVKKSLTGYRIQKDYGKWLSYSKSGVSKAGVAPTPKVEYSPTPKVEYQTTPNSASDNTLQQPKDSIKDIYVSHTSTLDKVAPQASCPPDLREKFAALLKTRFKAVNFIPEIIPKAVPTEKLDYFLWLLETGRVRVESVRDPAAYLRGLTITQVFPCYRERLEMQAAREAQRQKRMKEELEARKDAMPQEEVARRCRAFISTLLHVGRPKIDASPQTESV
ncbi:MAG: replication protein [Candidatus Eisenbacteria bacterium]|nr:replication protein [Candidatus Eisenbacteria bacterium]